MHFLSRPSRRWKAASWFPARLWAILGLSLFVSIAEAKSAGEYYVQSLPGQPDGPLLKMHAGHIEISSEHHGNLFFWHYQNRHIANRQRTVIWLNGGPGCSSMDGALMEIGPYRLKDDSHLTYNDGAWDEFANLLFVDNPVGTGFSYVDTDSYVHELQEMADQMVIFLAKFFEIFPEYEDNDLYFAGESYAGQHIPYIAKAIVDRNDKPETQKKWNLSGLLIGNGWIAPKEQSLAYLSMAYKANLITPGSNVANQLELRQAQCIKSMGDTNPTHVDYQACENILQDLLRLTVTDGQCLNMYDVRLRDSYPSCGMNWPPDLTSVTPYLRRQDVMDALHVNHEKKTGWTECSGAVSGNFRAQESKPTIDLLPGLLEKVPILLFSGDQDLICSHVGTEDFINNMDWNGGKGMELSPGVWAPRRDWVFEGEPAGIWQEARNLTYVLFYNSSHMVPFDYPRRTRDMLDRFLNVDIGSIGGTPTDSRIDGEKGLETSVGGHPNSTTAQQVETAKIDEARWAAYYKSGSIALVVVILLAIGWGWYVWRDRRRRAGYQGLWGSGGASTEGFLSGGRGGLGRRDVEAADFDESELDDLHVGKPREMNGHGHGMMDRERYSLGDVSDEEEDRVRHDEKGLNGRANGHGRGHQKGQ